MYRERGTLGSLRCPDGKHARDLRVRRRAGRGELGRLLARQVSLAGLHCARSRRTCPQCDITRSNHSSVPLTYRVISAVFTSPSHSISPAALRSSNAPSSPTISQPLALYLACCPHLRTSLRYAAHPPYPALRDGGRAAPVAWGEAGGRPPACITTRLRLRPRRARARPVAAHLGRLRRADLAAVTPSPSPSIRTSREAHASSPPAQHPQKAFTAQSSARWANAIIAANDDQYRLSRDAQHRHIIGLRAAIATIEKRLASPPPTPSPHEQRRARGPS